MAETESGSEPAARGGRGAFSIVGVGASAGGLAPTSELLRGLGERPGIGLVIIHHLDPTRDSGLVEVLQRSTSMSVVAAADGMRVEANHVYVVPPNARLLIDRGALQVSPRVDDSGLHLPIDRFFESLAGDSESMAVGVVLSGSGFDGTEGIKALKREGGITLAQDATASYRSMPESAVATGCVDFVLPPSGLARELQRIGEEAPSLAGEPTSPVEEAGYLQVLAAMQGASGVDFASYKHSTIRRRLHRRIIARGLSNLSAYVDLLVRDPAEVAALCEDVLIHVTGFFREPASFEAIRADVLPRLCESRPRGAAIRVWVPGCSTGEEVYSMAICLLEFLEETRADVPIKIIGTDLSPAIIQKARTGRYSESIEGQVSPARLQRFFIKDAAGFQIRRDVRDFCVFAKHDVTQDAPFASIDLISCRNLMIYLGTELQDRVVALFHYALREPGFLVLGSSETVRGFSGFVPLEGKNKIYARTAAPTRLSFDFVARHLWPSSPSLGSVRAAIEHGGVRPSGSELVHREADRLVLAAFAPAGVVVTDELAILQFRGQTGPFLEPAPGVASLDLLRMARDELRIPLRRTIDQARSTKGPATEAAFVSGRDGERRAVTLKVQPFTVHSTQQRFFLVLFEEPSASDGIQPSPPPTSSLDAGHVATDELREELASTRRYLESVIEQLETTNEELNAANEEVVSSNEEFRSTNEELQSAKEELQATNEELRTVNDELVDRNAEATRLGDDLTNILGSAEIPILLVGRDSRLRQFTPSAGRVFGLAGSHLGRELADLPSVLAAAPSLLTMVAEVLDRLQPQDRPIQSDTGTWWNLSVRPYVTREGRIDGTVISARNVDLETRNAERVGAAREFAENVIDTVHESLVVLDRDLRLHSANQSFRLAFDLPSTDIRGRRLDELERPELGDRALIALIQDIREGSSVEGFRLEVERDGRRVFLVNARHIGGTGLILLALDDVTEAEASASRRLALRFREALTDAPEGVLMMDGDGAILFANRAAAVLFGYPHRNALVGLSVDVLISTPERDASTAVDRSQGREREALGRRQDGTEFSIDVSYGAIRRDAGPEVLVFITDISQRKKSEIELREAHNQLRQMAFDSVVTEEKERRRIALELHDRIGQDLALAAIKLASARAELTGDARAAVATATGLIDKAIHDSRTLVFELSPPVLYDLGLEQALRWLAEDVEKRHGLKIEVTDDEAVKPLDDAAKAIVFRSVRELVMNVLKHAGTSTASLALRRMDDHLQIDLKDRGIGFDSDAADPSKRRGFGLLSIREQIIRLGGKVDISSAPETGTLVRIRVPIQTDEALDRSSHIEEVNP